MKKQKIKLRLTKMNISNLQNLHTLKGGQNTVRFDICGSVNNCESLYVDNNCGVTSECVTNEGVSVCGDSIVIDCGTGTIASQITDCNVHSCAPAMCTWGCTQ